MELRHLRYFIAVAEELSFSRAAERLRLAQPSLSTQVRDLEEEIGTRLLDRDRNRVALTDAGRVFLSEAKAVLVRANLAVKRAIEAAEGKKGELRVAAVGTLSLTFMPSSLSLFHKQFPDITVTFLDLPAAAQLSRLKKGQIHLGITPLPFPGTSNLQGLHSERLLQSAIMVVLNPSHRLAHLKAIRLGDLDNETFLHIRLNQTEGQRLWTESMCRRAGFTPRFGGAAETPENLLGMIAAGQGLALVPKFSERPASPGYVFRPIVESSLVFELFAIWNPEITSTLLQNFLAIVRKEAQAVQPSLEAAPRNAKKPVKKQRKARP